MKKKKERKTKEQEEEREKNVNSNFVGREGFLKKLIQDFLPNFISEDSRGSNKFALPANYFSTYFPSPSLFPSPPSQSADIKS